MPTYVVWIYCPFCLHEFSITVDAPTPEMAKKKAVGRQVTCPADPRHIFKIEEDFIVNAYPLKTVPRPTYKVMSEEEVKRARWLRAAIPPEEPLPIGARPVGWPKFVGEPIPDALTTFLFEQKVESKAIQFLEDYGAIKIKEKTYGPFHRGDITAELPYWKAKELVDAGIARWAYPWQEYRWKVLYRFDVFTKFYEEAKRMSRTGKICEAALYLIRHAPGITVNAIAQILGRGYWTVYRCIAKHLPPEQVKRIAIKEVKEQAEIEQWLPDEIVTAIRELEAEAEKPKAPKVVYGPKTPLGYSLYPVEYPTYEDLVKELRRILTLEGYMPTEDEWEEMKRQLEEQRRKWMKQKITYWLAREEEEE